MSTELASCANCNGTGYVPRETVDYGYWTGGHDCWECTGTGVPQCYCCDAQMTTDEYCNVRLDRTQLRCEECEHSDFAEATAEGVSP